MIPPPPRPRAANPARAGTPASCGAGPPPLPLSSLLRAPCSPAGGGWPPAWGRAARVGAAAANAIRRSGSTGSERQGNARSRANASYITYSNSIKNTLRWMHRQTVEKNAGLRPRIWWKHTSAISHTWRCIASVIQAGFHQVSRGTSRLSDSIGEIFYARYFAPTDVTVVAPSASVPPQC